MEHTTFSVPARTGTRLEAEAVTSLYHILQALPDPRRKQGKCYSLVVILTLVILAKLAGEQTMSGVTEWVRHRGPTLAQRLGLRRASMPCQTTYSTVLARVDGEALDRLLRAFFVRWEAETRCGTKPSRLQTKACHADHRHLALDGKTLRATTSQPHPVHQLACYEVAAGIVLWRRNVGVERERDQRAQTSLDARLCDWTHSHPGCDAYPAGLVCSGPSAGRTLSADRQGQPTDLTS